ncbi:MAG: universal stress protein [Caldilinea sp.]|nr:universal stress protein [Caldilinea sp.]MDW8441370.1 universal stress protein [Caldilineaceae bacterium]
MSGQERGETSSPGYILVALDASPYSAAALAAAAEIAAALNLELRGIYVEDTDLLHLCGLPFGFEIGSFTARLRRLEQSHIEREFQLRAAQLRKIMAEIAGRQRLPWSFTVVRGRVTKELLSASSSAHMVSLGRVGTTPGKRIGSTAQAVARNTQRPVIVHAQQPLSGPFTVVYLGDVASDHAVQLAAQLARPRGTSIHILALPQFRPQADRFAQEAAAGGLECAVSTVPSAEAMVTQLVQIEKGAVILPISVASWLDSLAVTAIVTP